MYSIQTKQRNKKIFVGRTGFEPVTICTVYRVDRMFFGICDETIQLLAKFVIIITM